MISPNTGHACNCNTDHIYGALSIGIELVINYLYNAIIATCYGLGVISLTLSHFANEETEAYTGEVNQPKAPS